MSLPAVATPAQWRAARLELLAEEKALTRARDAVSTRRRELGMVEVEKEYVLEGPAGAARLLDLFEGDVRPARAARASLTIATLAVLPVLIGLAVGYAIQMQARVQEEQRAGRGVRSAVDAVARSGAPTVLTAATATAAGFLALLLSSVPMVRGFGLLIVAGVVIALGLALTLGTAALAFADPTRSGGRRRLLGGLGPVVLPAFRGAGPARREPSRPDAAPPRKRHRPPDPSGRPRRADRIAAYRRAALLLPGRDHRGPPGCLPGLRLSPHERRARRGGHRRHASGTRPAIWCFGRAGGPACAHRGGQREGVLASAPRGAAGGRAARRRPRPAACPALRAPRAAAARPDRAGHGLDRSCALRRPDRPESHVGDAGRAGRCDLDGVQRLALRALPARTDRRPRVAGGAAAGVRLDGRRGARLGGSRRSRALRSSCSPTSGCCATSAR